MRTEQTLELIELRPTTTEPPRKVRVQFDESILLRRAQSGDGEAFSALVEPYLRQMFRSALRITRNHEDAEDVCQEGMIKAFVNIRRFQGHSRFSTWLIRIVMNEALMRIRKRQSEARHFLNELNSFGVPVLSDIRDRRPESDPEALCNRGERTAILREAINSLEIKLSLAVCLSGFEDRKIEEIAEIVALSQSGVKSRLTRAFRKLRLLLSEKLRNEPVAISDPIGQCDGAD